MQATNCLAQYIQAIEYQLQTQQDRLDVYMKGKIGSNTQEQEELQVL